MSVALSIQQALFREQQARIEDLVGRPSAPFRRYEAEYQRHTRRFSRVISRETVNARIAAADVTFVGDYHSLQAAQRGFLELAEQQLHHPRPLILGLECVDLAHQRTVDAWLRSRHSLEWLSQRLGHRADGSASLWANFTPLFTWGREYGVRIVALDSRASGQNSLQARDAAAAEALARTLTHPERPRVLVLMGQYHVAPMHLPRALASRTGGTFRALTVYQNAEGLYWQLARSNRLHAVDAVEIDEDAVCVFNSSPIAAQRSFLDFAGAMMGDALVPGEELTDTFATVARAIARETGVTLGTALNDVEVFTADSIEALLRRLKTQRLSPAHVKAIRGHILSQESAWLPSARAVYLSSFSLSHLAEEAAHFVRWVAVGAAMTRRRHGVDAFWARCVEEAIGSFGSKLVHPARALHSLAHWQREFEDPKSPHHREAAFVLALSATEPTQADALIPLGELELFHAASHGLGYLLGDALFTAWQHKAFTRADLRALMRDPLADARAVWATLMRRWVSTDAVVVATRHHRRKRSRP